MTVSPTHRRLGFYCHLHLENITHVEVAAFLRLPLRHLRGPIILLWDGGPIHGGADVQKVLARHPRLHVERFPAYAPELNPDEPAWEFLKDELANGCPLNVEALLDDLTHLTRRLRRSQHRLRGFVLGSGSHPFFHPDLRLLMQRSIILRNTSFHPSLSRHSHRPSAARIRNGLASHDDHEAEVQESRCGEGKAPLRFEPATVSGSWGVAMSAWRQSGESAGWLAAGMGTTPRRGRPLGG